MIIDEIKNLNRYPGFRYQKEIELFIQSRNCLEIPDGEIEILGRDLFVRAASYWTGLRHEKLFEAHRDYMDLQYLTQGEEVMEVSIDPRAKAATQYDTQADIRFFENPDQSSSVHLAAGQFIVFYPGELHKPGCNPSDMPCAVKKLVFKIKVNK